MTDVADCASETPDIGPRNHDAGLQPRHQLTRPSIRIRRESQTPLPESRQRHRSPRFPSAARHPQVLTAASLPKCAVSQLSTLHARQLTTRPHLQRFTRYSKLHDVYMVLMSRTFSLLYFTLHGSSPGTSSSRNRKSAQHRRVDFLA